MRKITKDLWFVCFLNRKIVLGPTYGSPLKKMLMLPPSKDGNPNSHYMAYIIQDKVCRKWFKNYCWTVSIWMTHFVVYLAFKDYSCLCSRLGYRYFLLMVTHTSPQHWYAILQGSRSWLALMMADIFSLLVVRTGLSFHGRSTVCKCSRV